MIACEDCGTDDPYLLDYMLRKDIWDVTGFRRCGCLRCLQRRFNRKLTIADFTDAYINYNILNRLKYSENK